VGRADADAAPANEKLNPAAPSAGAAALVTRFLLEACFTRGMVASSVRCKKIQRGESTLDKMSTQVKGRA
jgi:hypothetical protein